MQDLTAKIYENNSANVKTFIFLYYAGHGAMVNGQTVFVLNEKRNYPVEAQLRALAQLSNSYVVALLDCCRETWRDPSRGGGAELEDM